jgi:hypothetical protein
MIFNQRSKASCAGFFYLELDIFLPRQLPFPGSQA